MPDNRLSERKHTLYYSRVFDVATDTRIGFTIDISDSGMRMLTEAPLTLGHVLDLHVELPREIRGIASVELRCEVKWCQRDINPDYHAVGLNLIETDEALATVLDDMQHAYCFDK
jgi:hypothetical protein